MANGVAITPKGAIKLMKLNNVCRWTLGIVIITVWIFFEQAGAHERWKIKTSYAVAPGNAKTIAVRVLDKLGEPLPGQAKSLTKYAAKLLPGTINGFKEGDFVQTTAWLHLAAFSADDSDYHLQMTE